MLSSKTIAIVGAGHMGSALIGGILRAKLVAPARVRAARRSEAALAGLHKRWGVRTFTDNDKAIAGADIVILAVKPQAAAAVVRGLAPRIRSSQLVISLMAGITTETIAKLLQSPCPVVRAMPNTPAQVDAGATAIAAGAGAGAGHLALAERIFGSVGTVVTVPESAMDAVTGLSGTGPVYIFMLIEAMI
ncbi:MAG: NAD(P)-binding domain-containing protein, partial [Elusimicrobiota bacterium]